MTYTHRDLLIEELERILKKNEGKFFKVLEIGAGNFPLNEIIKKYNPTMEYTSIDSEMQYKDERNLKMDAHQLEFPDNTFDLVLLCHTAEHFTSPLAAFKQIHRVLRKDGIVLSITPQCCEHQIVYGDPSHFFVLNNFQWSRILFACDFKQITSHVQMTCQGGQIPLEQDYNIFSVGVKE